MQVEQAVFTSIRSRKSQGYHLVAASEGLDGTFERSLAKWGPSHSSLFSEQPLAESWNYHPIVDDWWAISRTMHGGPEYSGRGGLQVFTHYLILPRQRLAGYQFNPLTFARTARALGYLRLHDPRQDVLPVLDLPEHPLPLDTATTPDAMLPMHDILRVLQLQNRIAIIGAVDPLPILAAILQEIPPTERWKVSYCTGLRVSVDRSFRILFAPSADLTLSNQLRSQDIDSVQLSC